MSELDSISRDDMLDCLALVRSRLPDPVDQESFASIIDEADGIKIFRLLMATSAFAAILIQGYIVEEEEHAYTLLDNFVEGVVQFEPED